MGWVNVNKMGHEGFCVGLIEMESPAGNGWAYWREFSMSYGDETRHEVKRSGNGWAYWRELSMSYGDETRHEVKRFQVGCTCGWRSAVFFAPARTEWSPYSLFIRDEAVEEAARQEWQRHVDGPDPHALLVCVPEGR